ncbi:hypothetical protein EVAR_22566_1 [Eumeta japonica]|uniref:Uncharacterized protein n=1 Tax=Eumeta variegata TaxID=151549 RepID=A0A4C1U861_EUMVA|nr:hypothetical protein EVAR_22566_1 [Eumeta japonica]
MTEKCRGGEKKNVCMIYLPVTKHGCATTTPKQSDIDRTHGGEKMNQHQENVAMRETYRNRGSPRFFKMRLSYLTYHMTYFASCDFYLIPNIKEKLKNKEFESMEEELAAYKYKISEVSEKERPPAGRSPRALSPGVPFISPTLRSRALTVINDDLCNNLYLGALPPGLVCGYHATAGTCKVRPRGTQRNC